MLVIVPSRGRPQNIKRLIDTWVLTEATATLVVAIDDDDPQCDNYRDAMKHAPNDEQFQLVVNRRMRLAGTLNHIAIERVNRAGALGSDIIGFMGDDHLPRTYRWDLYITQTFAREGLGVVYGNDLIQRQNLPTAVFMSAAIIKTLGYMVPPGLTHMYLDNTWKVWGEQMERLTYLDFVVIEHLHPITGNVEWDAGYIEVNAGHQYAADEAAYKNYLASRLNYDANKLKGLLHG